MAGLDSHYAVLQVAPEASPEEIRAAYRRLAAQLHPDRNPGNVAVARRRERLERAFATLSDPKQRKAHDQWIAEQLNLLARAEQLMSQSSARRAARGGPIVALFKHLARRWSLYAVGALLLWFWLLPVRDPAPAPISTPQAGPTAQAVAPQFAAPRYERPERAPNGQAWPPTAGYISGYEQLHQDGLSTVTVDNSQNDSDVFAKLISLQDGRTAPVRHVYIPAHASYRIEGLSPGQYDLRYRDLDSGQLSRTEAFALEQVTSEAGTEFSNVTMTLYQVQGGNMQTQPISEAEF